MIYLNDWEVDFFVLYNTVFNAALRKTQNEVNEIWSWHLFCMDRTFIEIQMLKKLVKWCEVLFEISKN